MLIGDPRIFAVEAYHERPEGFSAAGLWGRMCLHIGDLAFGDISEPTCQLDHAILSLHDLGRASHNLWHESFSGMSDEEIFEFLDTALYRDVGQSLEQMNSDWSRFGRFSFLTNWGEQFDPAPKCFVFSRDHSVTVVWRDGEGTFGVASVPCSSFSEVAETTREWYCNQTITPEQ